MRRYHLLVILLLMFVGVGYAQQEEVLEPVLDGTGEDRMGVDLDYIDSLLMDSTFLESLLQADSAEFRIGSVRVSADSLSRVVLREVSAESSEGVMGYRIGLFFDNSSAARSRAAAAISLCDSLYGDVVTTLSYDNPYFKVSAGYCTTLEEALMLLRRLQPSFPKAFLVRERIMPAHLVEVRARERGQQE